MTAEGRMEFNQFSAAKALAMLVTEFVPGESCPAVRRWQVDLGHGTKVRTLLTLTSPITSPLTSPHLTSPITSPLTSPLTSPHLTSPITSPHPSPGVLPEERDV